MEHVVQVRTRILKAEDLRRLSPEINLACMCLKLGDTVEATRIFEYVTQTRSKLLKPDDPRRLRSEYLLARCYYESGKYEESLRLARSIEHLAQNSPGHPLAYWNTDVIRNCLEAKERGDVFDRYESSQGVGEGADNENEEEGPRGGERRSRESN